MNVVWHDNEPKNLVVVLYEYVKPFIDFLIKIRDFKKRNPIKACERAEIGLVFFGLCSFDGHTLKVGIFEVHRPRGGRRCETQKISTDL
jgi:hypothetical protein